MRGLVVLWIVVFPFSAAVPVAAQVREVRQGENRLKGITTVDVAADPVSADAARCGIARVQLQKTALETLAAAGLKVTLSDKASSWFYTVFVTVSSVRSAGQCSSSVITELTAQVQGIPEADRQVPAEKLGALLVGQLTLIRHNGIVSSRPAAHPGDVQSLLREHLTDIARRVALANK